MIFDESKILTCDTEVYKNYFLIMFRRMSDGKVVKYRKYNDSEINISEISYILRNNTIVTFNGNNYDDVIISGVLAGYTNFGLYKLSKMIIEENLKHWIIRKKLNLDKLYYDHIDLIEVAPSTATLKVYAGRMHCVKMQDLPIDPHQAINDDQIELMELYCKNDLEVTQNLFDHLRSELELRVKMSKRYNVDLRSKSDAQIAEAVYKSELLNKYGIVAKRPTISTSSKFYYDPPDYLNFETNELKEILKQYTNLPFKINQKTEKLYFDFEITDNDKNKKGILPKSKPKLKLNLFNTEYTIGIGGLHTKERSEDYNNSLGILRDYDVASYYPQIIISNQLYPTHLGSEFLDIYTNIVNTRLRAKEKHKDNLLSERERNENKIISDSLKVVINGTFGKFNSKWSFLYSPKLLIQATVTGQLCLLMLIERLELNGISVVSANTDGIVINTTKDKEKLIADIIEVWEFDTDFKLESTDYEALYSQSVNNYIAISGGKIKGKGVFNDQLDHYNKLRSNPVNLICVEAVKNLLLKNKSIGNTIYGCNDIRKFTSIRKVKGGAVQDNVDLGKVIRWYYSKDRIDYIEYKENGNKVPTTDGAKPLMNLPTLLPRDLDYDRYIEETKNLLISINCTDLI